MFRLTFTLAAALYAGFVIWGEPAEVADDSLSADAAVVLAAASNADFDRPTILGTTQAEPAVTRTAIAAPNAAVIAASAPAPSAVQPRLIGEPVVVSLVQPAAPAPVAAQDAAPQDLLRVTGSRVNMRSGPSTSNGVVASLTRGTLAEPIGEEINGWLEIRDVASGRTGFMAARFLEPS